MNVRSVFTKETRYNVLRIEWSTQIQWMTGTRSALHTALLFAKYLCDILSAQAIYRLWFIWASNSNVNFKKNVADTERWVRYRDYLLKRLRKIIFNKRVVVSTKKMKTCSNQMEKEDFLGKKITKYSIPNTHTCYRNM